MLELGHFIFQYSLENMLQSCQTSMDNEIDRFRVEQIDTFVCIIMHTRCTSMFVNYNLGFGVAYVYIYIYIYIYTHAQARLYVQNNVPVQALVKNQRGFVCVYVCEAWITSLCGFRCDICVCRCVYCRIA